MKTSDSIVNVAKALVAFNEENNRIAKDGKNPHFRNEYATVDQILDYVRPILSKNGLSIMQFPSNDDNRITMTTMLLHSTGEFIQSPAASAIPVKSDPQAVGSAITYLKRYSLSAMLGLSTGEKDDDGNSASGNGTSNSGSGNNNNTSGASGVAKISDKQMNMITAKANQWSKNGSFHINQAWGQIQEGTGITVSKDMSASNASKVIEFLLGKGV